MVALAVTIIVIIILATISLNAVVGDDGIIKKAQLAKDMHANSVAAEGEAMNDLLEEYNNMMAEPPEPPYVDSVLATAPNVSDGMTPVKWNGSNWIRTDASDSAWYNYGSKKWANVVLGDATFNADGTLDESQPYSQLVWIPRYAYQITSQYHTATSDAGNINVVFIDTANKGKDGTQYSTTYPNATTGGGMDDYVVHPAFDYDGNHLSGFWIGKYESSHTGCTTDSSTGFTSTNTTDLTMMIKANVTSWRSITISNMYDVCLNMNARENPYGLSSNDAVVDPHLTKNSEWGALAYLSKSIYGKNSEVYINNSSTYITGNAGSTVDVGEAEGITNAYNTEAGQQASTTGNVTGVYDMSGGAAEYVAAYVNNGHSTLTSTGASLVNGAAKYKDVYSVGSSDSLANNYAVSTPANGHYGDAVYETCAETIDKNTYASSWYIDYSMFPTSSCPFLYRGGSYNKDSSAGVFYFRYSDGIDRGSDGFRVVVPVF